AGQPMREEIDDRAIAGKTRRQGAFARATEERDIFRRSQPGRRVKAIDGKMREDFDQCTADRRTAHVAARGAREVIECQRRGVELRGEAAVENLPAASLRLHRE